MFYLPGTSVPEIEEEKKGRGAHSSTEVDVEFPRFEGEKEGGNCEGPEENPCRLFVLTNELGFLFTPLSAKGACLA